MKKPLRSDEDIFFSLVEGKLSALASDEAWFVVHAANQSLKRGSSGRLLVFDGVLVFEDWVRFWLERVADNEPISELTDDLNERIRGIPFIHILNPDEQGQPRWEHIAVMQPDTPMEVKAAHAISLFLASGGLKKLKRCKADGCQQFFLGPPNRKWCGEKCGSRMRGRKLRKERRRQRYAT